MLAAHSVGQSIRQSTVFAAICPLGPFLSPKVTQPDLFVKEQCLYRRSREVRRSNWKGRGRSD